MLLSSSVSRASLTLQHALVGSHAWAASRARRQPSNALSASDESMKRHERASTSPRPDTCAVDVGSERRRARALKFIFNTYFHVINSKRKRSIKTFFSLTGVGRTMTPTQIKHSASGAVLRCVFFYLDCRCIGCNELHLLGSVQQPVSLQQSDDDGLILFE